MITYINKDNANSYNLLFEEATRALRYKGILKEDEKISSLNDYFSHIQELLQTNAMPVFDRDPDTNELKIRVDELTNEVVTRQYDGMRFAMLPVDEAIFDINANTRTITVPDEFTKLGVAAVQGDQIAEVLYFSVDRFFDATDLATQNIMIEWTAPAVAADGTATTIKGYSIPNVIDVESVKDHLIFGWPLSSHITQTPGKVTFAVRFYTYEDGMRYSLSTLTAQIEIKEGIGLNVESVLADEGNPNNDFVILGEEIKELIRQRAVNSSFDNTDHANKPEFLDEARLENSRVIYLTKDENNNWSATLSASAFADDGGDISYFWKSYDYKTGDDTNAVADKFKDVTKAYPAAKSDEVLNLMAQGVTFFATESFSEVVDNAAYRAAVEDEEATVPVVYRKDTECEFSQIGVYTLRASNKKGRAITSNTFKYIVVYRPADVYFTDIEAGLKSVIVDDAVVKVTPAVAKKDVPASNPKIANFENIKASYPFSNEKEEILYTWYKCADATLANPEALAADRVNADGSVDFSPNVEDLTGYYYCEIQGVLNNDTTDVVDNKDAAWRITRAASMPVITITADKAQPITVPTEAYDEEVQFTDHDNTASAAAKSEVALAKYGLSGGSLTEGSKGIQIAAPELANSDEYDVKWYEYTLGANRVNHFVDAEDFYNAIYGKYLPQLENGQWPADDQIDDASGAISEDGLTLKPKHDGFYFCIVTNTYNGNVKQASSAIVYYDVTDDKE